MKEFRVWNGKEMFYPEDNLYCIAQDGRVLKEDIRDLVTTENTPMFYTGLKDKNGKEIYERDIVEADWGYGCPRVKVELETIYYAKGECCISNEIEVIGDSYQNPELLKVNK